ncbi:N-acetyltransferase [Flavobacterium silvisoli]|uniref:N-acetyltransferase n=1 Tax=Flavobacterium silvisoli TaxID=2529433 RepID=A0A4Q9Z046_9FLAO|nr:GNAT family N-acetyltransferase [Flavobacterium silvisoli]TBX69540.1 N-acetyltransferase [Flavobacterium silvisoli]
MYTIKEIAAPDTFSVRHPVLRSGKPVDSCHFDGDNLPTTHHYGIFGYGKLVGVASFFKNRQVLFPETNQVQLRGMAILKEFQGKGLGEMLLKYCEQLFQDEENCLLWFNARSHAVGFYEKLGYQVKGDSFEIKDIGTHFIMYKNV